MTDQELLLTELKKIRAYGPIDNGFGICSNLSCECDVSEIVDIRNEIFKRWPKYSGDVPYPIPGGKLAYKDAQRNDSQWNREAEYGRLRWELLDFMISELEKDIENYLENDL